MTPGLEFMRVGVINQMAPAAHMGGLPVVVQDPTSKGFLPMFTVHHCESVYMAFDRRLMSTLTIVYRGEDHRIMWWDDTADC